MLYTFDDVLLEPKYSDIRSRSEVDIGSSLGEGLDFDLPVISSPMDTVTEVKMATKMSEGGGLGILHRYNTIDEQVAMVKELVSGGHRFGAAVGVSGDFKDRVEAVVDAGCSLLCVDVAHGHHILVKEAIEFIRNRYRDSVHIMAGNVATSRGYSFLNDCGADSVRYSVGAGCFVPGTKVYTEEGEKSIEDVKIGDTVISHLGNKKKVINTIERDEEKEVYNIKIKDKDIRCTTNHEFYVVLKKNSEKVSENNIDDYGFWVSAEELDENKHLLVSWE